MSTVAIKVENISKQYRLGEVGTGTISHDLNRWWHRVRGKEDPYLKVGEINDRTNKGDSEYVWALQDIDFEVQQGEVLGIIGKNGAGKSTLLKILSKVTSPSTGAIKAKGRIASLLEVGTGFHPELTGRENIYLNGTILGMRHAEVKSKLDEIVDFAGVERYLDTPVKRYSSGMMVRLGFAVAAHLEPEILIVDEVLAVGDAEFQKKAIGKIQDVSQTQGRTVLFVSHNMAAVYQLCSKGILLHNGKVLYQGETEKVLYYYRNNEKNNKQIYKNDAGNEFSISYVDVINKNGESVFSFEDEVNISIKLNYPFELDGLHLGVALIDKWKRKVFTTINRVTKKKDVVENIFDLIIPSHLLLAGNYTLDIALFIPNGVSYDYLKDICQFVVEDYTSDMSIFGSADTGIISVKCQWK